MLIIMGGPLANTIYYVVPQVLLSLCFYFTTILLQPTFKSILPQHAICEIPVSLIVTYLEAESLSSCLKLIA